MMTETLHNRVFEKPEQKQLAGCLGSCQTRRPIASRLSAVVVGPRCAGCAVRAGHFGAVGIDRQRVVSDLEAFGVSHIVLAFFNLGVVKLLDLAAVQAHQVVVVLAFIDLVDGLA